MEHRPYNVSACKEDVDGLLDAIELLRKDGARKDTISIFVQGNTDVPELVQRKFIFLTILGLGIYQSQTAVRFRTQLGIYLKQNGLHQRAIDVLSQLGITTGSKAIGAKMKRMEQAAKASTTYIFPLARAYDCRIVLTKMRQTSKSLGNLSIILSESKKIREAFEIYFAGTRTSTAHSYKKVADDIFSLAAFLFFLEGCAKDSLDAIKCFLILPAFFIVKTMEVLYVQLAQFRIALDACIGAGVGGVGGAGATVTGAAVRVLNRPTHQQHPTLPTQLAQLPSQDSCPYGSQASWCTR